MLRFILCCLITTIGSLLAHRGHALSKHDLQQARSVAQQVHQRGRYQNQVPLGQTPAHRSRHPDGCGQHGGCFGCQGCVQTFTPLFQISTGCAELAPWIFLVLAVVLLVAWLRRYLQRVDATRTLPEPIESKPTLWGVELPTEHDPTGLAAQGHFADAIGVFLWRALRHVGWQPEGVGKSQTPREIVHQLSDQDHRVSPLQQLLLLAEKIRFGGVKANQEMFLQAQEWYHAVEQRNLRA